MDRQIYFYGPVSLQNGLDALYKGLSALGHTLPWTPPLMLLETSRNYWNRINHFALSQDSCLGCCGLSIYF